MNIVQLITSQFGGETINKLGSLLGESPERTQSAVGAAVPTLLGGLASVASSPDGAQRLSGAVSQQSPDVTSNFASTLGSGAATSSPNLLGNLFGGTMLNGLTSALGQFTGMKSTAITSLLGTVAPLVLGFLNKQKTEQGLDASGLANFLNGQKQNITSAMPSGLSKLLGNIPGFGLFTQATKPAAAPAAAPAYAGASPSLAGTSSGAASSEPASSQHYEQRSTGRWLIPLLIALAIILALWSWSHRTATNTTPIENPVATTTTAASQITSGLQNSLSSAASTLGSVTDANSAQQATPQLAQLNDKISSLKASYDKLPASAKSTMASTLQPTITKLQELSAKARGIPGVGDQFKSTLDQLDSSLSGLANTTANPNQ